MKEVPGRAGAAPLGAGGDARTAPLDPPYGERDRGDMAGKIASAPAQIVEALERLAASPWPAPSRAPDLLAVGAMGGSAIAADLARALDADRLPRPVRVVRGYRWPACVTSTSLALLCSYSGETEETLALYLEARGRGVPCLAVTTGGTLAGWCRRDGVPWARLPEGMPPRASLYASWVTFSQLLHALGWIDDPAPAWREAAQALRERAALWAPAVPEAGNPAKQSARSLKGKSIVIYASAERLGPVATRLRNQLNENAKQLAHSALFPELNHNEIVGWEPSGAASDRAVVLLGDPEEPHEIAERRELTAEYVESRGALVVPMREERGGRLARTVALVQLGDYVSLYLALLNGIDPTPIASIDAFKRRLAESRRARAGSPSSGAIEDSPGGT